MQNSIIRLGQKDIAYGIRISHRTRRMCMTIKQNGAIVITLPYGLNQRKAKQFMIKKSSWILCTLARIQSLGPIQSEKSSRRDYIRHKITAQLLAENRVHYFNTAYKFHYRRITIKNQKTRWGSCSGKGNLNFNYKIALLPPHLSDYIIVHELCHLAELNHSPTFWNLVAKTTPHHRELRKELRKNARVYR